MRRIAITAVAVLAGVACGEYASPPESIVDPVAARAPTPPECDTKAAIDLMRAWFPRDLRRDAAATIRDLGDACAAEIRGDEATDLVFALVTVMEQIVDEGTATGTPADGAALLNELLSFGAFGCGDSCAVPAAVFAAGGTLGVRFPSDESPPDLRRALRTSPVDVGATGDVGPGAADRRGHAVLRVPGHIQPGRPFKGDRVQRERVRVGEASRRRLPESGCGSAHGRVLRGTTSVFPTRRSSASRRTCPREGRPCCRARIPSTATELLPRPVDRDLWERSSLAWRGVCSDHRSWLRPSSHGPG